MHPYFEAKGRMQNPSYFGAHGYMRDLHETYKDLPRKSNVTFDKGLAARNRERVAIDGMAFEFEEMKKEVAQYRQRIKALEIINKVQGRQLSNFYSAKHGSSNDSQRDGTGSDGIPVPEASSTKAATTSGSEREVGPSLLPDSGGPADGVSDEGRQDIVDEPGRPDGTGGDGKGDTDASK